MAFENIDTTGLTRVTEEEVIRLSHNPIVLKEQLKAEGQGMHVVLKYRSDDAYPLDQRWWDSADLVTIENAAGEIVGVPKNRSGAQTAQA